MVDPNSKLAEFDKELVLQNDSTMPPSNWMDMDQKTAVPEQKTALGEKIVPALEAGTEMGLYMTPWIGDLKSAQDSIRAGKAAMEAEKWPDKIKLFGWSTLAAAGAIPIMSTLYDASGPSVKMAINAAIKKSKHPVTGPGKKIREEGVGSGIKGKGTGRGPKPREIVLKDQRNHVDGQLKKIWDEAPKDKDGNAILSADWYKSKDVKQKIYDSNPDLFPEWKNGVGQWNDLTEGFLSGKIIKVKGKRVKSGDRVDSVDLPVTKATSPYDKATLDFKNAVSKKLKVEFLNPQDPAYKYLNFIRLSESDALLKDSNKFFKKYKFDDLNTPGTKLNTNFEKFKVLENKRIELRDDPAMQALIKKIFPDEQVTFQIAHTFESSKIRQGRVSKSKKGKGGDPDEMYIDLSAINVSKKQGMQKDLESKARKLEELYTQTGDREILQAIQNISKKLDDLGVQGQTVTQVGDLQSGFILGSKNVKFSKKLETLAKNKGVKLTSDDYVIMLKADNIINPPTGFKTGGMVQSMKDGGNPHLESERLMAYDPGEYTLPVDPSDKDIDIDIGPYHDLSPWMDIDDLEFLFDVSNLSPEKIMEVLVQNGVPVEKAKAAVKRKVMKARDGGIVQYFQNAGEVKGISKFDVKPYIPPSLRIDEDPLTLGDIGETASEVAETAWPYMIPGVGEHLSKKDYEMFSAQAAQAWEEKNYPKYAGMLALGTVAAGGIIPNWTVVGAVPNVALGIYKGVRKALTPKMIAPPIKMEKRFTVQDDAGNKFYQTKSADDAEVAKLRVQDAEGKNMNVVETEVPIKPKKTKQEIVPAFTLTADDVIGSGNNRLFYSKMDHYLQGTNGNLRVKTGASGNVADIPINEVRLSAKEWHDSFRAANIKESELVDSYIRQYLNKKGNFKEGKFTNNQPIAYAEIKELMDQSPSKFVQASKYSDADGTLKFADSGRAEGYKNGTREEHVLWMDSKDIRGDIQELPSGVRGYEGHKDMRKVTDDVNFGVNNKLEGEPYVIGWSLVDDRPGKLANGKSVTVTTANEIQSDFLQKAASKKAKLKKDLRAAMQSGDLEMAKNITTQLDNVFRQMPATAAEVKTYIAQIEKSSKVFDDVAKMDLNVVDDAVMKQLDDAAKMRDEAINNLNTFIDDIDPSDLFPNIPFKDQKDWVSSLIKNDIAIAAKKRFYFDESGVLQINKNAPSHYTVSPSKVVKNRWSVPDQYGMHVPANMRTTQQHGKGVAYDLEYGGPNVTDASGRHFTGNAEETLKKIASSKNAEFSIGKVKFKNKMEDSFLIELTPEMLTPYVQYFKHGGLVEAIPYNPLRSVLDVLGPIGAY